MKLNNEKKNVNYAVISVLPQLLTVNALSAFSEKKISLKLVVSANASSTTASALSAPQNVRLAKTTYYRQKLFSAQYVRAVDRLGMTSFDPDRRQVLSVVTNAIAS